ncbi:hypothetical protein HDU76_011815, partial [Blyttiomyces sp. JEL0837]
MSVLAVPRYKDDSADGFNPWTFMTVRCWGEDPLGTWRLNITDERVGEIDPHTGEAYKVGQLVQWSITVHGTCDYEDVIVDPMTGLGTCAHTLAKAARNARVAIFLWMIVISATGLLIIVAMLWKRVSYSSRRRFSSRSLLLPFDALHSPKRSGRDRFTPIAKGLPLSPLKQSSASNSNRLLWIINAFRWASGHIPIHTDDDDDEGILMEDIESPNSVNSSWVTLTSSTQEVSDTPKRNAGEGSSKNPRSSPSLSRNTTGDPRSSPRVYRL